MNRWRKLQMLGMFGGGAAPVVYPWYLAGGIPAANCIGAYKAINVVDQATSYDNLTGNATYDLTTVDAPDWDGTNGWKFNGSSHYLKTAIIPTLNQTWSMAIRYTTGGTGQPLVGVDNAGTGKFSIGTSNFNHCGTLSNVKLSGIASICGANCYDELVLKGTIAAASAANTQQIYIGAVSRAGAPSDYGDSYIQAIAFWNIDISAYQGAVHAAMAALPAVP